MYTMLHIIEAQSFPCSNCTLHNTVQLKCYIYELTVRKAVFTRPRNVQNVHSVLSTALKTNL